MSEPAPAHVDCSLQHRIGSLELDLAFATSAPWTILFGPSGSGKSTVLRILAGLLEPQAGAVFLLGRPVSQSTAGLFLPPHLRPTRWSGQQTALFPRLTVQQNLAFSALPTEPDTGPFGAVDRALDHFGLRPLAGKRPHQLSGGEQQRVAVVRAAFTARNRLLLLDEPFTGLDASVRDELILQLKSWLGESPVLSVTHDVSEAFRLNAEVVRIDAGRVVAQGPAAQVLANDCARLISILGPR